MKKHINLIIGLSLVFIFVIWTILIKTVDVTPSGPNDSLIGLSFLNVPFMQMINFNKILYDISDVLMIFIIAIPVIFNILILIIWIKTKKFKKIPVSLIILDVGYAAIVMLFILFEILELNYRPVLIDGTLEASYPSTHMLTSLFILLSASFVINKLIKDKKLLKISLNVLIYLLLIVILITRLLSGVHWISDMIGGALISLGIYYLFVHFVNVFTLKEEK